MAELRDVLTILMAASAVFIYFSLYFLALYLSKRLSPHLVLPLALGGYLLRLSLAAGFFYFAVRQLHFPLILTISAFLALYFLVFVWLNIHYFWALRVTTENLVKGATGGKTT